MKKRILFLFVAMLLVTFAVSFHPAKARQGGGPSGKRYVARYTPGSAGAAQAITNAGGTIVANYSQIGVLVADSENPNFTTDAAANAGFTHVLEDQTIQWIPNEEAGEVQSLPEGGIAGPPGSAALLAQQWNLFVSQTNLAWNVTQGSSDVKVAVLDTGICAHHQDLAGKVDIAQSASFITELAACGPAVAPACVGCPDWEDRNFHGTHVAGIISSNNIGTASVAPNVRLRAVKVLACNGSGSFSAVIAGIMFAATTGNDVINMSLGAVFPKNVPGAGDLVSDLNEAVNFAKSQGVLVVSAAGNEGIDLDHSGNLTSVPCQSGSGMCVGATTRSDALATFSNHGVSGPQLTAPGGGLPVAPFPATTANTFILAPCSSHSVLIPACAPGTFYLFVRGTSQAAPHVSGAAALVDSIAPGGPGSANPAQLRNALLKGTDDLGKNGTDNIYSKGRLNVLKAVQ